MYVRMYIHTYIDYAVYVRTFMYLYTMLETQDFLHTVHAFTIFSLE